MKIKSIICLLVTLNLLAGGLTAYATDKEEGKESEKATAATLEAQAKITKAAAQKIALDKVPGGTIKEGDIEKEKGKLLWSFDIATPGTKDITEVQVDAMTGAIIDVSKETVADQEKEKKEDAKEKAEQAKESEKATAAKLEAQAKITKAEAQKIALAKVPNGTIKEGEIENEKGKLIWSFDIATPGTKDITEVNVDAMTGAVIDVSKETVADQAKEKKKDDDEKEEKK